MYLELFAIHLTWNYETLFTELPIFKIKSPAIKVISFHFTVILLDLQDFSIDMVLAVLGDPLVTLVEVLVEYQHRLYVQYS